MSLLAAILTVAAGYFIGAVPFGYLIARARGVNIFEHGSGNIGATNVGRILGKPLGFLVFLLDFSKGAVPVALALWLKGNYDDDLWTGGYVEVASGLAAFLGHIFPVYLGFRGGKGVAAGCGAVAVLLPIPTLAAVAVWFVLLVATRYMSLASIAAIFVLTAVHLRQPAAWDWLEPRTWFCVVAGVLVILRHHANLVRLFHGNENQLRETYLMQQLCRSLHVLALGLWFGMTIFFTFVVALTLLNTFETAGESRRESWFPLAKEYAHHTKDADGAKLVDGPKEQGTRAFGYAITPMFTWYFALQGACGFIALATALQWLKQDSGRVHRWRANLLLVAVILVLVSWPVEQKVHALREPRNQTTEAHLQDSSDETKIAEMKTAKRDFFTWHTVSLFLNFATIICVTGAMAIAGNLGPWVQPAPANAEAAKEASPSTA